MRLVLKHEVGGIFASKAVGSHMVDANPRSMGEKRASGLLQLPIKDSGRPAAAVLHGHMRYETTSSLGRRLAAIRIGRFGRVALFRMHLHRQCESPNSIRIRARPVIQPFLRRSHAIHPHARSPKEAIEGEQGGAADTVCDAAVVSGASGAAP